MISGKDRTGNYNKIIICGVIIYSISCIVFPSLLSVWLNASIAGAVGILVSVLISFTAYNAYVSFPRVNISNIVKYAALHLPDLIFQVFLVFFLRHGFGCNRFLAYTVAALLGMVIAFLSVKKQLRDDGKHYALDFHDDPRSFIEWINVHQALTNVGVIVLMAVFFSISNWSTLLGENLMKWDIWNYEYNYQLFMTDALAGHTIPIWNPLMTYGMPWYSMTGSPVWYPFTLILAYFGYTPVTIAISYVMHLVIGGFGAFLLISLDAKTDSGWTVSGLWTGIIGGLLYGGCGIFLSNAQHIMIIISAAWIPYVFYYVRRFIVNKRLYYGAMAGLCTGFIFLGGYPEMFYNLFLFLFGYVIFLCYQKEHGVIVSFGAVLFRFGTVCVFTVSACAISLFPFLCNKDLLTRGSGGVVPNTYPLYTLLSVLFPMMPRIYSDVEQSMVNYYMGILVVLLIPMLIKSTNKYKKVYAALAAGAFMLCGGSTFFIHSILYRFLPMYSAFRFPTTNRAFLSLFMILLITPILRDIMDHRSVDTGLIRFIRIVFLVCGAVAISSGLMVNLLQADGSVLDRSKCLPFSNAAFISTFIVGIYLLIFTWANHKRTSGVLLSVVLAGTVCIELLAFAFVDAPISITLYEPTAYIYSGSVQNYINDKREQNSNRVRDVNFANHVRSSGNITAAALDKTFDDDIDISFQLSSIVNFRKTYIHNIIKSNPVIYFTNDVVTAEDVVYEEWANACDTPPEQIFVEERLQETDSSVLKLNVPVKRQEELALVKDDNLISLEGDLYASTYGTGRVRVYLDGLQEDTLPMEVLFIENDESRYAYQGNFHVDQTADETYVEIFFPDVTKTYARIQITCPASDLITGAQLVVIDHMEKDSYVDVSYFGFNDVMMTVNAPSEGYVTLLQTKHDGWSAYVDGEKQDISLVDQCFMGIHLAAGEHTIVMKFRPKEFFVGAILTGMYFVFVLILMVRMLLDQYRKVKV